MDYKAKYAALRASPARCVVIKTAGEDSNSWWGGRSLKNIFNITLQYLVTTLKTNCVICYHLVRVKKPIISHYKWQLFLKDCSTNTICFTEASLYPSNIFILICYVRNVKRNLDVPRVEYTSVVTCGKTKPSSRCTVSCVNYLPIITLPGDWRIVW